MKKIEFKDYKLTCGAVPVTCEKNDCNAFHYSLSVELTLDEQERLAVSGRIKFRIYSLGCYKNSDFFIDEKIPFNDTIPSHVQKRLDNMGCKILISTLEMRVIENCIQAFNNHVKSEEYNAASEDFKIRRGQFMKEFMALKEKFGVSIILDQYVDEDGIVDAGIIIRDTKYKNGYIEDCVDVDTVFDGLE